MFGTFESMTLLYQSISVETRAAAGDFKRF